MYGQIHMVVKELVETKFGGEAWAKVLPTGSIGLDVVPLTCLCPCYGPCVSTSKASQLNEKEHFLVSKAYPDQVTMTLFEAVASTLALPLETVLRLFGEIFLNYCFAHGYDKMLTVLGGDFNSFIQNLDSLHSLLSFSYKDIVAPSFRCFEKEDGSLLLHYYSMRKGLYPIVQGVIQAVGKRLFYKDATVTVVSENEEEIGHHKRINHVVMQVQIKSLPGRLAGVSWALGDHEYFRHRQDLLSFPQSLSRLSSTDASAEEALFARGTETIIRAEDFSLAFPYHMVLNSLLCIYQCGHELARWSLVPVEQGTPLREVAVIVQPAIQHTMDNILKFINSIFVLAVHRKVTEKPLILRGQMIWMTRCAHLLFVGSPRLVVLDDLKETQMHMSDLPLYDVTRDLVLLNQQRADEMEAAVRLDSTKEKLTEMYKELEAEKEKRQTLLQEMLPPKIARKMLNGETVDSEKIRSCTVLFSDVVNFTDIVSNCRAVELIDMLNDMYQRFDSHADPHGVFKMETIGDAYMAVTGVTEVQEDHAQRMADFAMDMLEESANVESPSTRQPIKIRLGMHTGPVVAAMVGKKKPHFDVYGATVNIASRMQSLGAPDRIHVSKSTFKALYPYGYKFRLRGPMQVSQRGMNETYFLIGTTSRKLDQPHDRYSHLVCVVNPYPQEPSGGQSTSADKLKTATRGNLKDRFLHKISQAVSTGVRRISFSGVEGKLRSSNKELFAENSPKARPRRSSDPVIHTREEEENKAEQESMTVTISSSDYGLYQDNAYFGRHNAETVKPSNKICAACVVL